MRLHTVVAAHVNCSWTVAQDVPGVPARSPDRFGAAVALDDVDGDGRADLAVGAPGDSTEANAFGESSSWGSVTVLRGSAAGLGTAGAQYWTQASPGVPRGPETGDRFGEDVQLVDLGRLDQADLVVGVPGEDGGDGLVHVLYGGASGLTTDATTSYTQASPGIPGSPEDGDGFAVLGP